MYNFNFNRKLPINSESEYHLNGFHQKISNFFASTEFIPLAGQSDSKIERNLENAVSTLDDSKKRKKKSDISLQSLKIFCVE